VGSIFESKMTKLIVHSGVEISDKEVTPELVQNIHVIGTIAWGCNLALLERLRRKEKIRFMRKVGGNKVDRSIVVFDPIEVYRSERASRCRLALISPRRLIEKFAFVTTMDISTASRHYAA